MAIPSASPTISVGGNVEGSIVVGDNNFVVNNNHGTIVYQQAQLQVRLRDVMPRPPRAPRSFLGRVREVAELEELIGNREPVLIHGIDGIGKTYLVKKAANGEAAQAQSHGVLFLEGIDRAGIVLGWDDLLQQLFDALYESDPQLKVNYASARTYLSNTSPLVLLDNLVLNADTLDNLADLFPQAPILAVSNRTIYPEAFEPFELKHLQTEESVQLLATRARIDLEDTAKDLLVNICALLNNFPLAIATVGHVVRENDLSLERVLSTLDSIQTIATQPNKVALERSFQFANSFLNEDERQMMALTAAAPSISADREWLQLFSGGSKASEKLEAMSLLQANSPRLRLHPEYASLVLGTVDADAIRSQLLTSLTEALQTRALDFEFVKQELGNILGLLNWAVDQQRWQDVVSLGRAVDPYLTLRGLWNAWHNTLDRVLTAARALGDQAVEAWALHQLGTRSIGTGELQDAVNRLNRALDLRESLGDHEGMAYTQHNLDYLDKLGAPLPPTKPGSSGGAGAIDPRKKRTFKGMIGRIGLGMLLLLLLFGATTIALAEPVTSGRIYLPQGLVNVLSAQSVLPIALATDTPTPSPSPSPSLTPTNTATPTRTSTPTATATLTPTSSPTSTRTPTQTLTPTEMLTPTITAPDIPLAVVSVDQANCRYGPGTAYLYADGLYREDVAEVVGRNFPSTWLLLKLEKNGRSCWAAANTLEVSGDPASVPVTQPSLPRTDASSPPTGVQAMRNDNGVTVTWDQIHSNFDDARGYLLDVTVCQNGFLVQIIVQTDSISYDFTDEPNCSVPSSGKIYSVDVRGYSEPIPIPWP